MRAASEAAADLVVKRSVNTSLIRTVFVSKAGKRALENQVSNKTLTQKGQKIIGSISGKKYRRVGIVAAKMGNRILAPLQYDSTIV